MKLKNAHLPRVHAKTILIFPWQSVIGSFGLKCPKMAYLAQFGPKQKIGDRQGKNHGDRNDRQGNVNNHAQYHVDLK